MRVVRSLWWKLALSYVVITLAVVLTAMLLLAPVLGEQSFREALNPSVLELPIKRAVRLLQGRSSDADLCQQVLADLVSDLQGTDPHAKAVAENLASTPGLTPFGSAQANASVAIYSLTGAQLHLRQNADLLLPVQWSHTTETGSPKVRDAIQIVMPMDQQMTMVVRFHARYNFWRQFGESKKEIVFSALFQSLFYALPGAVFGALFAGWIARRLRRFSNLAQAWAGGDFSQRLRDKGGDELSQHADLLDRMADDLSAHLLLQQQLTTAEARNHLARELHDSVKQQCFGVGLQLHAAQAWLGRDVGKSAQLLAQAQSLNQSVQSELVGILQRLKHSSVLAPSAAQSLVELAGHWANEIETEVQADFNIQLSESTAHELMRIAGEAIANVVRHARATQCTLKLAQSHDRIELTIKDNGCGFDPSSIKNGLGLPSMRERAQALPGGAMDIQSSAAGSELRISWNAAASQPEPQGE
jgi:signal transduction histidine kinase